MENNDDFDVPDVRPQSIESDTNGVLDLSVGSHDIMRFDITPGVSQNIK